MKLCPVTFQDVKVVRIFMTHKVDAQTTPKKKTTIPLQLIFHKKDDRSSINVKI